MNFYKIKCRGWHTYLQFSDTPVSLILNIKSDQINETGEIIGWILTIDTDIKTGTDKDSLLDELFYLSKNLEENQIIIIWTNKLPAILGFFRECVTSSFPKVNLDQEEINAKFIYIQLLNHLEFRDIKLWNEDLLNESSYKWTPKIKALYNEVFIPNKNFYITPSQKVRKILQKNTNKELIKKLYPSNYEELDLLKSALFGGLCYCHNCHERYEDNSIIVDATSAYIFDLLCCKHIVDKAEYVPSYLWSDYLDNNYYTSLGTYLIKFHCKNTKIKCYKNVQGYHLHRDNKKRDENGNIYYELQTQVVKMNNIDLKILLSLIEVESIECLSLVRYKLGRLPISIARVLAKEFIKKDTLPKDSEERRVQKKILLSIYGESIRTVTEESFRNMRSNACLAPQWGIWTTSYCKKYLFELASQLEYWRYSDTDCIICKDTEYNRKIIDEYNEKIRQQVKETCDYYGFDFEPLKNLGKFKLEEEVVDLLTHATKEYMYKTKDGRFIIKAAGCDKRNLENYKAEELFEKNSIPTGDRLNWRIKGNCYYEWIVKEEMVKDFFEVELLLINLIKLL